MRLSLPAWACATMLSVAASAQGGLSGSWKLETIGSGEAQRGWSMPTVLDVKIAGTTLTGTMRAGNWPGESVVEGIVGAGGRFSFTAISQASSSNGFPKMGFTGIVTGDTVALTMEWLAFAACQTPACSEVTSRLPRTHQMTGERVR